MVTVFGKWIRASVVWVNVFKCYLSLCFTKYLESQTLMGPPNTTLTLPSHTSVQMVSSLPCVSPVGISATSLPCVCAARLKPKLFSCPSCTTMSHHHNSHILQKSTIVNFLKKKKYTHTKHTTYFQYQNIPLKHITKHIFLIMNTINTYFLQHFLNTLSTLF